MEPICTPQPGKRERTRAAIVNAAITVTARKGLEASSIDDLMTTAGMARGTFYNYFSSREDLLRAVIRHIHLMLIDQVVAFIPPHLPPATTVACMLRGYLKLCLHNREIGRVLIRISGFSPWLGVDDDIRNGFAPLDRALLVLCGDDISFVSGRTYIQGITNTILYHLLQDRLGADKVEELLHLTLRGLGVDEAEVVCSLAAAAEFAAAREFAVASETFQ